MRVRSSFVSILFCKRVHFDMRDSISWFLSFFLYGLFTYPFPVRLKLNKGWLLVISSCRWSDKISWNGLSKHNIKGLFVLSHPNITPCLQRTSVMCLSWRTESWTGGMNPGEGSDWNDKAEHTELSRERLPKFHLQTGWDVVGRQEMEQNFWISLRNILTFFTLRYEAGFRYNREYKMLYYFNIVLLLKGNEYYCSLFPFLTRECRTTGVTGPQVFIHWSIFVYICAQDIATV